MKGKTMISVMLPIPRKTFDFWVPRDMTLHDVTVLVQALLEEQAAGCFRATDKTMLADRRTGALLDIGCTVEKAGLVNGSRLMIV